MRGVDGLGGGAGGGWGGNTYQGGARGGSGVVIVAYQPNQAPVADSQHVTVERNTPKAITLTGSDPDNEPLTFQIVTAPEYGALSGEPPNVIYSPPTLLDPGTHAVTVVFVPNESANYENVDGTVDLEVLPGDDVVVTEWPAASGIVYGQPLSASVLTGGSASAEGTFAFTSPETLLTAGSHVVNVRFTPADSQQQAVEGTVTVTVAKATPVITAWPTAGALTYGQYLGAAVLSGGTASVAGSFAFDDPAVVFQGQDAFTFRVGDGEFFSDPATVSIGVGQPAGGALAVAEAAVAGTLDAGSYVRGDGATVLVFTGGTGTWTVPDRVSQVEVLSVGGGGGGGASIAFSNAGGGGGGAGGLVYIPAFDVTPGATLGVTVGAGGAPGVGGNVSGTNGGNSLFGSITALGGGGGSGGNVIGNAGGSGGGSRIDSQVGGAGQQPLQPGLSGQYGYGNNGGAFSTAVGNPAGGGGGAGAAAVGITGGAGWSVAITGAAAMYGGGGGGGGAQGATPGNGGAGGGGRGANDSIVATPGTANTGGGGGGGNNSRDGARGGDGVVIIAYHYNNSPPVADAQSVVVEPGVPKAITLTGSDIDSDPLTFEVVTQPLFGSLSGTVPNLTYTPPVLPEPGVYDLTVVFTPSDPNNYESVTGVVTVTVSEALSAYEAWAAEHIGSDLSDPDADDDGDGASNFHEFAFGLDPTSGASSNPIIEPFDPEDRSFRYSRRVGTGLKFAVSVSVDLREWEDLPPNQWSEQVIKSGEGVEIVEVTLADSPEGGNLFIRIRAD